METRKERLVELNSGDQAECKVKNSRSAWTRIMKEVKAVATKAAANEKRIQCLEVR